MTTQDIEACTLNTIRETEKYIVVEKKQVLKIGNIAISLVTECLFEIYDFRTGLKVATLSVHKNFCGVDSLFEFFENFEIFTKDIVNERDFLLKKFVGIKMQHLPCGTFVQFQIEEFEQFLLENQP
nr:MAG TPA: hypothetical protein [Caudoviricetes sp.]